MTRTFSKLKKTFREEMKEKNANVIISRDFSKIIVKYQTNGGFGLRKAYIKANIETYNGFMEVQIKSSLSDEEEINYSLISFLEKSAKELGCTSILIAKRRETTGFIEKDGNFKELSDLIDKNLWSKLFKRFYSGMQVKEFKKGALMHAMLLREAYIDKINELVKKDPTFKQKTLRGANANEIIFSYYYKGYDGEFPWKITDGKLHLSTKELGEIVSLNKEEVKKNVEKYFKKIEEKRKLKNIFDYPRVHFDEKMKSFCTRNEKTRDTIYEYLTSHYAKDEVEMKFAALEDVGFKIETTRGWYDKTKIVEILNHLFIITKDEEVFGYTLKEKEKVSQKFKEILLKEAEDEFEILNARLKSEIGHLNE